MINKIKKFILTKCKDEKKSLNEIACNLRFFKFDDGMSFLESLKKVDLNVEYRDLREKLYIILNDIKSRPVCKICGDDVGFKSLGGGFRIYCSNKCINKDKSIRDKIKNTCIEKYGIEIPQRLDKVKNKMRNTCIKRYNVDVTTKSPLIKDKTIKTNLRKFGVKYSGQSIEIKTKALESKRRNFFLKLLNSDRLKDLYIPCFEIDEYSTVQDKYTWLCKKCGNKFEDHLEDGRVPRCPLCFPYNISKGEKEILEFCKIYMSNILENSRDILDGKEIDIFIPEINLGIEFNGIYYHSEKFKPKYYHQEKMMKSRRKGIRLIQIFEDEWYNKRDIVKSIILVKMGLCKNKIFARKCYFRSDVNSDKIEKFYDDNHLQGYIRGKHILLCYNNEIVSAITIGKPRFNKKYDYEILRFCNKKNTVIVGGLSKLIKYFIKKYQSKSIITYVDARFGDGKGYLNCGFRNIGITKPGYFYISNNFRQGRYKFQKHKLEKILPIFDPELTEIDNMQLNGYHRVWDCGNYIYSFS